MSRRCIGLLVDHRVDLVGERTRIQNRLRWHLLELCSDLEQTLPRGALNKPRHLDRVDRRLRRLPTSARTRVAREQIAALRVLNREIDALAGELLELVTEHRPQLLAERGCGPLTAAILIGRTAGAERFKTDASFARQAGVAPIRASSGQRDRHRLHRGGDRQLNHALHIIAITRTRYDPATKAYIQRKQAGAKPSAASNATSHGAFITCSHSHQQTRKQQTSLDIGETYSRQAASGALHRATIAP